MARILAVDDDRSSSAWGRLDEVLQGDGHDVVVVTGAEQARQTFAQRGPFDLVAVDLPGPGLEGIELCRRLKASAFEYLPVVLLSRGGTVGDRVLGLDAGADDCMVGLVDPQELLARVRSLLRIRASHRQAADLSHVDLTTGIPNRRALEDQLRNGFALAHRTREYFALLVIDMDGLEKINTTHGRDAGDEVRRVAAAAIQGVLRQTDGAYCVHGGEFVVLAPGADIDGGIRLAERIRRSIETMAIAWHDAELRATVSVGLAVIPHRDIPTAEALLAEAERALLAAKRAGRNCMMVHGDDDETAA